MTVINTNTASINAQFNLNKVNKQMEAAMEQLSSGKRINTASDDAAGMAIASRITSEVKGIEMAIRNSSDAQALIDTAEGAHQEVENILQRARELAVQASNDTNSSDDRASLQLEINQLLTEVDRISANTSWAGKSLMGGPKGGSSDFSFQIGTGNAAADTVKVSIGETSAVALGIGGSPSGVTGRDTGPAGMRIDGNKIIVEGTPAQGDTFEFSINDVEVDIIYSQTDQYSNDISGVAAQLKDEIDALVAAGTLSAMTVTDNGDGTLSIAQSETPAISTAVPTTAGISGAIDTTTDANAATLTLTGDYTAGDVVTMDVGPAATTISYTVVADDTVDDVAAGLIAALETAEVADIDGGGVITGTADSGVITLGADDGAATALANFTFTANSVNTATISDNIITLAGDFDGASDAVAATINGITATYTKADDDGFADGIIGAAAGLKQAIEGKAGLENIIVTDNGDGSLTFTQSAMPVMEAAEVGLTTPEAVAIAYDDSGVLAVTGSFVEGQQISFDLFGETVSFTTKDDDGFNNTLAGIANQMAAAINNAGISGVTAAKTASVNSVTITADVIAGGGVTNSGSNYVVTTVGSNATATVGISGTDVGNGGTATTATFTTGDAYTFEVAGKEFSVIVGTDGYTDDIAGLSEQMKDTIDAAGIVGLVVTANTNSATAPQVSITRTLTDTTTNSGGSTIVTNIQSLAADEIAPTEYSGAIDVSTADLSANAINRIDAALLQLNAQRAELGAVSNRMDYTINNLSNVSSNLQGGLSRIQDADFAKVTGDLTKSQIMSQAATAMLAQANASKQGVLSLLQG
ncbi:flagellin [Planktomarina temperata]|nr:flagellin [Planktomarina temperata]